MIWSSHLLVQTVLASPVRAREQFDAPVEVAGIQSADDQEQTLAMGDNGHGPAIAESKDDARLLEETAGSRQVFTGRMLSLRIRHATGTQAAECLAYPNGI